MASEDLAKLASIESVSSLAFARNTHPNELKTDDQLLDGISVVTGELSEGGFRVILTSAPGKYCERKRFEISSVHGYQTELPDRLEDRNKLCANLLGRRGEPVIQCDGGERQRLRREVLPELRLDDAKVEVKKWKGSSNRHIEDMFADMRRAKHTKTTNKPERLTVSDSAPKTPTAKRKRPLDGPLVKMLEAQAKRCCCKRNQQSPSTSDVKRSDTEDEEKSPGQADMSPTKEGANGMSSTDQSHSTEVESETNADEDEDDKRAAPKSGNVRESLKTQTRKDDKSSRNKRSSTRQSLISFTKIVKNTPSSQTATTVENGESTAEETAGASSHKAESNDEDDDVILANRTLRRRLSQRNKSPQNEQPPTRRTREQKADSSRSGRGAHRQDSKAVAGSGRLRTTANDPDAPYIVIDESVMDVDPSTSASEVTSKKDISAAKRSTIRRRRGGKHNTMLTFVKRT